MSRLSAMNCLNRHRMKQNAELVQSIQSIVLQEKSDAESADAPIPEIKIFQEEKFTFIGYAEPKKKQG